MQALWYLLSKAIASLSSKERGVFGLAVLVCAVSGTFIAVSAYYNATEEVPAEGGRFTEGIVGQPTFMNPLIASGNEADYAAVKLMFADLDTLAASFALGTDGASWVVTLKDDLMWDDGEPLTADDVVFTVEALQDPSARSAHAVWQGVMAEKLNDNEVRFTLRSPYAFFGKTIRSLAVAPRHIFGGIPAANLRLSEYNLAPIGSGPYSFKRLDAEPDGFISRIELVRNPHYAGNQPRITSFFFRFYRAEADLIRDFNAKRVQGAGSLTPDALEKIQIGHRLESIPLPRYYAIFFNQSTHPALKDRTVRTALSLVIPRTTLVQKIFRGHAAAMEGPLPPAMEGYEHGTESGFGIDVEVRAAGLLEKAGWAMDPADGVRYRGVGKERARLEFKLLTPDMPFLAASAKEAASAWAAIGVKADIAEADSADIAADAIRTRNYQMLLFGNILKESPDMFPFWHSSQKFSPGLNLALYDNKAADALLEKARVENDDARRRATLREIQNIIREDTPAAFLFSPAYLYAVPKSLRGFSAGGAASPADRLSGIEDWYLRTKRSFKKQPGQ